MACVPCESALLAAITRIQRSALFDSLPYTTAPSNRPLVHSPAAPVKRSKETLGTDNVPQTPDDSILPTTRSFQNDNLQPGSSPSIPSLLVC